jgi:hypothetical protein
VQVDLKFAIISALTALTCIGAIYIEEKVLLKYNLQNNPKKQPKASWEVLLRVCIEDCLSWLCLFESSV